MAGFNISMERINNDYSRVVDIGNEIKMLKSKLYDAYELQKSICEDLRLAGEALGYVRKECRWAKRLCKHGETDEGKHSEYDRNLKYWKDSVRMLTKEKRKTSQTISDLRGAIESGKKLLTARVDARHDWET